MNPIIILAIVVSVCGFLQWANYRVDAGLPVWPFHKKNKEDDAE